MMTASCRNCVLALIALLGGTLLQSRMALSADCDTSATVQQCCSKSKCSGKVLSNRDAHNCKDKSKGKSWHPAAAGAPAACTRL
jgi:hypothetical protein